MARRAESIEVLIADDDDQFRRELIDILSTDADVVVVGEATDGEAAVAMAADLVPDIVLIDVWLPGTGGIEATRARRTPTSEYEDHSVGAGSGGGG